MVTFADPIRLWLLAVPALAAAAVILRHRRRLALQRRLASPAVWDRLMGGAPATGLQRLLCWCVAGALVVVALARPQWGEIPAEESVRTRDLVFAVDVSDSMLCPDVRPTRLGRSLDLVRRVLPAFEGNRVGVVVFAGEAYPLVPLTTDLQAVDTFLDVVEPGMVGRPGSNVQLAVDAGLKLLPEEGEGRVLVFFSDGENLQGDLGAAAKGVEEAGVGLLAVIAGTEDGGPIPVLAEDGSIRYKRDKDGQPVVTHARREAFEQVADKVNGEVIDVVEGDAVRRLIDAVESIRTREVDISRRVQLVERFPIFLGLAALALVLSFVLSPWRRRAVAAAVLLLILLPGTSAAQMTAPGPPPSAPDSAPEVAAEEAAPLPIPWWQRFIPGGSRRLARSGVGAWQEGEFEDAARDFAGAAALDPENGDRLFDLGTALAAGGLVEPAVQLLEQADAGSVENAAYNAGTASLQQQQAEAAVNWLRKALLANPDDPDVKRNYELALKLLQQQQEEQQDQDKDCDEEQQEQEQQEQEQQEQEQEEGEQPTPTPSPSPSSSEGAEPTPTPTPDPNNPLYAALDQAEAEAREQMRSPTPQAVSVEKDW